MPSEADLPEFGGTAVGLMVLNEIEPGAEMLPGTRKHDHADSGLRRGREEADEFLNGRDIQRVAFCRTVQCDDPDAVIVLVQGEIFEGCGVD